MRTVLLAALAFLAAATTAAAQVTIPDVPNCANCRIEIEELFTFGAFDGPGSLAGPGRIGVDGAGRIWYSDGPVPQVFDAEGRYLRALGREGEGPGEYRGVYTWSRLPGDSTLVFDEGNGRAVVLDPDLQAIRYVTLPVSVSGATVLRWPDAVLGGAFIGRGARAGQPLHVLDMSGSSGLFTTSMMSDGRRTAPPGGPTAYTQQLFAPSAGEGAWSAEVADYRVSRWDSQANPTGSWTRQASWFHDNPEGGFVRHSVSSIGEDDRGRLWVLLRAPRSDGPAKVEAALADLFRDGPPSGPVDLPTSELPPPQELYDTVMEVLDVGDGTVLARQRFEAFFLALLPGGRVAAYREEGIGIPRVAIMSLTLVEP
jgi:hypothetical protein